MFDPVISHHFSGGLYAKHMFVPQGHYIVKHVHDFDHLSILAQGRVLLRCDGDERIYVAPHCLNIKAGVHHEVIALEDTTWFCLHVTDETDPDLVDDVLISKEI